MKRIISGLLLGLFCALGFPGVAFAETPQWAIDCAKAGGNIVGDECDMSPSSCPQYYFSSGDGECTSWAEYCAEQGEEYAPEIKNKSCVTAEEKCTYLKNSFYDSDANSCVSGKVYCAKNGQEYDAESNSCKACSAPEVFDPTIQSCYDPNVTPSTVLPTTKFIETDCELLFLYEASHPGILKDILLIGGGDIDFGAQGEYEGEVPTNKVSPLDVLGCAIKTGRIHLWMIPFYIKYFIQFALSLAGLVAVGAIIIGGYFYLFGSFADDKDKGKRAIIYGIVGFIIAILAWTIVNVVISIATR
ncbi:MAG: pilin [Candidatus Gracilibacteria bacterium]